MRFILASTGGYPRIGDGAEQQRLRRAYGQLERGEISRRAFSAIQDDTVREVIAEQIAAGVELVTDGMVRWHDPISHIAAGLRGFQIGGLMRFFDTNCLFRQPIATGKVRWEKPILVKEFSFAQSVSSKPVKAVLTGPFTLAKLAALSTSTYRNAAALTMDCATALAREIAALAEAGAKLIQIDEPALLKWPKEFSVAAQALEVLAAHRGKARLALYTYFGAASPLYEKLQNLPVETLGLDFIYDPKLADLIARRGTQKVLGLGLVDGRNTKLENVTELHRIVTKLARGLNGATCYLNPSCGLEYLPRDQARRKLENMAVLKQKLEK